MDVMADLSLTLSVGKDSAQRRCCGFTLMEMLVSVAILAILLAVGIPSYQHFIRSSRLNAVSDGLKSAIYLARSEAVTRGLNVTLCRRNSAGDACANGGSWDQGWLISATGVGVLRTWDAPQGDVTLSINEFGGGSGNAITFESDGSISGDASYKFVISGSDSLCYLVSVVGTLSSCS